MTPDASAAQESSQNNRRGRIKKKVDIQKKKKQKKTYMAMAPVKGFPNKRKNGSFFTKGRRND